MNTLEIATDKLHYKRIREEPMYRLQLQMNDMRAEQELSHCQDISQEVIPTREEKPWTRKQWDTVNQLRGMVNFLYSKETERRAKASKRKKQYKYE